MRIFYTGNKCRLTKILLFTFLSVYGSSLYAQTYFNGAIGTGTTSLNGTAAPAGTTWHELQNITGNTTESNSTLGISHYTQGTTNFTAADDFVVPAGQTWTINSLRVYALDQATTNTTSPYNNIRVRIYNGVPGAGGTVVFGDLTTNRFTSTAYTNLRAIFNSNVPTPASPSPNLPVFSVDAALNVTLTAGTYWVEWQVVTAAASFSLTSQTVGVRTMAGYNARQSNAGSWADLIDLGNPATAPDVAIDLPFRLTYTTGVCTGTPAPGNTLSSLASVCAGTSFSLSAQNATAGSGVTYQWQSASAVGGPYTNIIGATNASYTSTLAATTFYQLVVTCGGNVGTSTPVQVALNPPTSCYCIPAATDCTDGDLITNVTFGALNNSSACSANGYTNYSTNTTIAIPDIVKGGSNPITITAGTGAFTESVGVWIDYNQNGVFETAEFTLIGTAANPTVRNGSIVVPATALSGTTRMRVRVRFSTALTGAAACTAYAYGETEDYAVNIINCVPLAITGQPASATITCGGTATFSATVTGSLPTYQWQVKTGAAAAWTNISNSTIYSGTSTRTLTVANAPTTMSGNQYRLIFTGACSGPDFSSAATLTINKYIVNATPTSATICAGTAQQLSITNTLGNTVVFTEGFNAGLPAGWSVTNNSSPLGTFSWFQGDPATFPAYSGAPDSYLAANFQSTTTVGTASTWLFTPVLSLKNGDFISFYTRIPSGTEYPDRLELRLNTTNSGTNVGTTATSVGDFTTLLLSVNPTLTTGVYPTTWTQFTGTISGLAAPISGRVAFRYFVTNAGSAASNSNYVGIDDVTLTALGGFAKGGWNGQAGTIFTDATATTPYVAGTLASTVYVKPTVSTAYKVSVNDAVCGISDSTTINVTVNNPITGTSTTTNKAVCVGGTTSFTATAPTTGGVTNIQHQWKVSTNGGVTYTNLANSGVYSGATTGTLTITGATAALNGNRYKDSLYVTSCTSNTVTNAATLTVNPLPVITVASSPLSALYVGQTTTLTATVSPNAAATYVWFRNGDLVPGANAGTLAVNVDQLGSYTVRVTDVNGCVNTSAAREITAAANDNLFIYPSPNTGQFQVRFFSNGSNTSPRSLNIYDSKGTRVYSRVYAVNASYTRQDVDLSHYGKGIYSVELLDGGGKRLKTGRVIVL